MDSAGLTFRLRRDLNLRNCLQRCAVYSQGLETRCGCADPGPWLVRDVPFSHGDVAGCFESRDGLAERGVVGLDEVAQGGEVDLRPVAECGHRRMAHRGKEGIVQAVPWMGESWLIGHCRR